MRIASIFIAAALALARFPVGDAAAQAWVQKPGAYYSKITASYLSTDEQYNFAGNLEPIANDDPLFLNETFLDVSFIAYVEYGLSDRYTLVTTLPFKISTTDNTQIPLVAGDTPSEMTRTNGGLGDLWVSLRTPFVQSSTAVSLQGGVKVPLGYEDIPENGGPSLGTSEIDFEINLFAGQSLYPIAGYISAGIGYRFRGGDDFDDEVIYNVEGGYTTGPLFLKLRFEGLQNVGPITDHFAGTQLPLPGGGGTTSSDANARNQDRYQINPVIAFNLTEGFGITAEAFHVLGGKNTVAGTTWVVGMVFAGGAKAPDEE